MRLAVFAVRRARMPALARASLLAFSIAVVAGWCALARGAPEKVIRVVAKKFEFSPSVIKLKKRETVVLELTSLDRTHGFEVPELGWKARIAPGLVTRLVVTATRAGQFEFHCNVFCGSGHEDMSGTIVVE